MKVQQLFSRRLTLAAMGMLAAGLMGVGCDRGGSNNGGGTSGGGATSGPSAGGGSYKLAFVTNNASDFWKIAQAGVHAYEKEAKIQVDFIMPPTGVAEEQNQTLENLASQGYNAIAISVIAPNDQVPELNRAASKAKLITFDSDAPKSNRLLYIGTNNYEAGKALGQQIVKLLPEGGEMAVFVGTFSADNAAQRLKGVEDAIAGHNINIVERREDQTNREAARSNVETVINARPNLKLVTGLWSYNGPAIAAAIESTGKKGVVKAAVFDEEDGTLRGIESGTINVTVVQKPFQFGYLASKWMHDLAAKPDQAMAALPKDKQVDTGVEVITSANVKDFKAKLDEMKKQ